MYAKKLSFGEIKRISSQVFNDPRVSLSRKSAGSLPDGRKVVDGIERWR